MQKQQRILLDKLVKGIITDEAYKPLNLEYETEITLCRAEIHDSQLDELDVEGILNAAEYMFSNLAVLWDSMELNNRQRFQLVLFPSGLAYTMKEKYGTNVTSPVINVLEQKPEGDSRLALPHVLAWNQIYDWIKYISLARPILLPMMEAGVGVRKEVVPA